MVNITYDIIRGSIQNLSTVEGALAEPGQDFISGTGTVILQNGQTSVAIPVTILEVKTGCLPCWISSLLMSKFKCFFH